MHTDSSSVGIFDAMSGGTVETTMLVSTTVSMSPIPARSCSDSHCAPQVWFSKGRVCEAGLEVGVLSEQRSLQGKTP